MSITTAGTDTKLIDCPYCKTEGFDWGGLKLHIDKKFCEVYGKVKAK